MLDLLDTAHPLVTTLVLMVMLVMLWLIQMLNQRLRIMENRVESLEHEQRQVDEELAVLSQVGLSMNTPSPSTDTHLSTESEPETASEPAPAIEPGALLSAP